MKKIIEKNEKIIYTLNGELYMDNQSKKIQKNLKELEEEVKKEQNKINKRKKIATIGYIIIFILICWFCLLLIEFFRVRNDQRPLICIHEVEDVEDDDEYSKMCYGILYKYKEYYFKKSDKMSARELTLAFLDFKRISYKEYKEDIWD